MSARTVSRRRLSGFGLIELMIAMVLGLLVIGAAFAVFQSNQTSYRANEGVNRLQESARVAHEMISRDLRSTGGGPCSNVSKMLTTDTQYSVPYQDEPLTINSTTAFTTFSGDDASYRLTGSTANSVTLDTRDIPAANVADVFKANDWLLLCNASHSAMVQISAVSGSTLTYSPAFDPRAEFNVSPTTASAAKLRSTRWTTANNGRGGSSLYMSRLGAAAEEVAEGVQSITVSYLTEGEAAYEATPSTGANIIAARIDMVLQGADVDGRTLTRNASNVINLRSHTP